MPIYNDEETRAVAAAKKDKSRDAGKERKPKPQLRINTSAPSDEPFAEESPAVGRRVKRTSTTPVSALQSLDVNSAPGSASVRTSSSVFNFDDTLKGLLAERAEFDAKLDEEEARLRQEEETPKRGVTSLLPL